MLSECNPPWPMAAIGDIAKMAKRPEEPLPGVKYRQVGIRLWGKVAYEREVLDGINTTYKQLYRTAANDIIVNKIWARNGSVAVVPEALSGCYASSEFPMYAPDITLLEPRWFHWITKTAFFWQQCNEKSHGTSGKNRIRPERFLKIEIPLPPLEEQQRIVARIESLAAKVEAARELREQAGEKAESLLGAVLNKIFKNSFPKMQLSEIASVNMGQSPPGETYNQINIGLPLLNGPTEFTDKHPIPVQWTSQSTKTCHVGDLLICVRGNTTGKMNWADKEYCIGRGLAALTADQSRCMPGYLRYFLQHQAKIILGEARGSTFPNLPGRKLRAFRIPLPPLPEQRRIVAYLDALQAKVAAVLQQQATTQARLESLMPAILDQAFRGEL